MASPLVEQFLQRQRNQDYVPPVDFPDLNSAKEAAFNENEELRTKAIGPIFANPKFAEGVADFTVSLLRTVPRAEISLALDFWKAVGILVPPLKGAQTEFVPKNDFEKFLLGSHPVRSVTQLIEDAPEEAKRLPLFNKIPEAYVRAGAPLFVPLLVVSDAFPFIGGSKKIGQELLEQIAKKHGDDIAIAVAKKGSKQFAEQTLKASKDDAARLLAKELADIDKTKADLLQKIGKAQKKAAKTGADDLTARRAFRFDKLGNLPKGTILDIEKRLAVLGLKKLKVRTFADVEEAAARLGTDLETLVKQRADNLITDKEVVGLRNIIRGSSEFIAEAERKIINNPALEKELRLQITEANIALDKALEKLVKGGTEAGRTVASFRILANQTLDPEVWLRKAKQVLGNRPLTPEAVRTIREIAKTKDRAAMAQFVAGLRKAGAEEKLVALWKAGLLTSPSTHLANITGNITMATLMSLSDVPSTGFDILFSLFTGTRTVTLSPRAIAAKARGTKIGLRQAREFLRTGRYNADILNRYDLPRQVTFNNKILQGYTDSVFRSLGAEDIVFRSAAFQEAMEKQAILMAKNARLKGEPAKQYIRALLMKPDNSMIMNAIDAAEFATFQGDNIVVKMIQGLKGIAAKNKIAAVLTEMLAPFTKTPVNIAARIIDFSPAGFITTTVKAAAKPGARQKILSEGFGRATTGSGLMALGAYLRRQGLMTGAAPKQASERDMFFAEGKQQFAIHTNALSNRLTPGWLRIDRASPFGNVITMGAEFERLKEEKEGLGLAGTTVAAFANQLMEQTFLRGVQAPLQAIQEPERRGERFIQQQIGSFLPAIFRRAAVTAEPTLRVPGGVVESIKERLPGLRQQVAVKRDIFGEPAEVPGGRAALIAATPFTKAANDIVIDEAKELDINIGLPPQKNQSYAFKMDEHEYSLYQGTRGRLLKQVLLAMINSDSYQKLARSQQERQFRSVISEVSSQVNDAIMPILIKERYGLPEELEPETLKLIMKTADRSPDFKKASDKRKGEILRLMVSKLQTGTK